MARACPLASFRADDLESLVDALRARGVETERFPGGEYETDERGIAEMPGIRSAWIRDPDGQVISLFQPVA